MKVVRSVLMTSMTAVALTLSFASVSNATDAKETVKEGARELKKNAEKAGRAVKDEACEMKG